MVGTLEAGGAAFSAIFGPRHFSATAAAFITQSFFFPQYRPTPRFFKARLLIRSSRRRHHHLGVPPAPARGSAGDRDADGTLDADDAMPALAIDGCPHRTTALAAGPRMTVPGRGPDVGTAVDTLKETRRRQRIAFPHFSSLNPRPIPSAPPNCDRTNSLHSWLPLSPSTIRPPGETSSHPVLSCRYRPHNPSPTRPFTAARSKRIFPIVHTTHGRDRSASVTRHSEHGAGDDALFNAANARPPGADAHFVLWWPASLHQLSHAVQPLRGRHERQGGRCGTEAALRKTLDGHHFNVPSFTIYGTGTRRRAQNIRPFTIAGPSAGRMYLLDLDNYAPDRRPSAMDLAAGNYSSPH